MDPRAFLALLLGIHLLLSAIVSSLGATIGIWTSGLMQITVVWLAFTGLSFLLSRGTPADGQNGSLLKNWHRWSRWGEGTALFLALALTIQVYTTLKIAIPRFVPFYADPFLAEADAFLFGTDAWRITHYAFGAQATRWLDIFYLGPCAVVSFAMALWASYSADRQFSRRAVLAICMCWLILGVWGALMFSSVGPIYYEHFYGDPRYAELASRLSPELGAVQTQAYLLDNFGAAGIGKGISAMPSMHNAIYLLLIWMIYDRFGNGWQMWSAVAFEAVVLIASVHLGWHYILDGIVAALLVPPIWWAAGKVSQVRLPFPRRTDFAGRSRSAGVTAA